MDDYETLDLTRFIASKIRGLMAQFGVSQGQLAEAVGVSQSQLSKMVRGTKPISIDQFDAMCWAFGVDSWEVLKEADDFLLGYDRTHPTRAVFVQEGIRLDEPMRFPDRERPAVIPVATGRKKPPKAGKDVGGSDEDVESKHQSDHDLAAKKRSGKRYEENHD